jgi:hypothetical protein
VTLTPYSLVEFETNCYSVPADKAQRHLVVRAYPFEVEILDQTQVLARHVRCYDRHQEVFDPLHYLPLLEQRPGAFAHAKPLRRWRAEWPPVYERLLAELQAASSEGQSVREFVRVLKLHQHYPAYQIEAAVAQALAYGCLHADGVELCLRQQQQTETVPPALDLAAHPQLGPLALQPPLPDLQCYDQLLSGQELGRP